MVSGGDGSLPSGSDERKCADVQSPRTNSPGNYLYLIVDGLIFLPEWSLLLWEKKT